MPKFTPPNTWRTYTLPLLRIVSGFLLSLHGLTLILGFFSTPDHPAKPAALFTLIWFAGILQLVGGLLLTLGLFTRPVAFILSGIWRLPIFWPMRPKVFGQFSTAVNWPLSILSCSFTWPRSNRAHSAWTASLLKRIGPARPREGERVPRLSEMPRQWPNGCWSMRISESRHSSSRATLIWRKRIEWRSYFSHCSRFPETRKLRPRDA
jgi:putative oxidoreductase